MPERWVVTGRQEGAGEAKARRYFEKENAANAGKSEGCGGSGGFTQKETVFVKWWRKK